MKVLANLTKNRLGGGGDWTIRLDVNGDSIGIHNYTRKKR